MKKNNTEEVLNDLIQLCRDGENGYRDAAESVKDGFTQMLLKEFARRRSRFAAVLQGYVRAHGGTPQRKGSVAGSIHKSWMNFQCAIGKNDDRAIISECKRGEEFALRHYKQARSTDLPSDLLSILQMQAEEIEKAAEKLQAINTRG